jgi:hypothetical protein
MHRHEGPRISRRGALGLPEWVAEFLAALAHETGGRMIVDAKGLADVLMEPPVAPGSPIIRRTPLWSRGWVLSGLLALLAGEWFWRRWLGRA